MAKPHLTLLSFSSLEKLDNGDLGESLQHELERICNDCMDRPGEDRQRSVTLKFVAKPIKLKDGGADAAAVEVHLGSKMPAHETTPVPMKLTKKGFYFNAEVPGQLDQPGLFDE